MAKKHHHMELRGKVWYFVSRRKDKQQYHVAMSEDENVSLDKRDDYLKETMAR